MKLLVIGGTRFVGRHLVEEALQRGHAVTLFNRGKNASLFPNIEQLYGDRDKDVSVLGGKLFDAVIDTCGYIPRHLQTVAEVLPDVPLYVFISTISVYADPIPLHADEHAPLATLKEPTEQVTNETYGALKVSCENVVTKSFKKSLIIRPGIIVGPYDHTDRFGYWINRVAKGGEMLAPGKPGDPRQFIDARDLASWTVEALERRLTGTFNVITSADSLTFGRVLETTKTLSPSDASLTWVDEAFVERHDMVGVLPLYAPEVDQNWWRVSSQKAVGAGLTFRSLEQTIQDTLAYLQTLPKDYVWKAGLSDQQEQEWLQIWHQAS
jgi:2'-hydroxyisoflavone reductase